MANKSLLHSSLTDNIFYRSMLAGNEAYFPEFESDDFLEEVVLTSSATSVTFSGLDAYSDYKHLQIRMVARTTDSWTSGNATLSLNGSGMAQWHYLTGQGSSVSSGSAASSIAIYTTGNTATSGSFASSVMDILDFSSSKNKTIRTLTGFHAGGEYSIGLWSNLWNNTAAVTSLTLTGSNSFTSGSRFSLYGSKG